jgi:hypothetical protein
MSKKRALFLCISICFIGLTAQGVFAQQEDNPDMRLELIRSKAQSEDELLKLEALKWVDRLIISGTIDPLDEELMEIVVNLGLEPFLSPQRTGVSPILVNDLPLVRREAAVTLGRIGGPYAVAGLIEMSHFEDDIDVLKNILYAFGNIASNADNGVTEAIRRKMYRLNATGQIDDELAYAALYAIEQISIQEGVINDPGVYETLLILSQERFSDVVTDKAASVTERLWEQDLREEERGIQTTPIIPDDPENAAEDDQSI